MATVYNIQFEDKDFEERHSYDDLEAGDYVTVLTAVDDIAATNTDNVGWGFVFDVKGLPLTMKVWLKGGGKWKVREVFAALGSPILPGNTTPPDPNPLVGRSCVATVVKEKGTDADGNARIWTNISRVTPLVKKEAAEVADFSDLEVTAEQDTGVTAL
jgi:hypothetical protein